MLLDDGSVKHIYSLFSVVFKLVLTGCSGIVLRLDLKELSFVLFKSNCKVGLFIGNLSGLSYFKTTIYFSEDIIELHKAVRTRKSKIK